MNKEVLAKIKKELIYVGIIFVLFNIIFKVVLFKENYLVLFRTVLSIFWLFALPGYFIMIYWAENLEFIERFVIGIALAAAITGLASYYLGLIGLNLKYHVIVLPLILIFSGILINLRK